jgi:CobQ-like glutamine amidotransferase family enzyme
MTVTIVSVYPELLGTYGDSGNVLVLRRRLAWRGIDVEVVTTRVGDPLPTDADLYVLGGSEDDHQSRALEGLRRSGFADAVAAGAHVFAVCAGLQLLGHSMRDVAGTSRDGMGLLDLTTSRLPRRVVGEVVADFVDPALPPLTGFANHGGGSELGPAARPLARTRSGSGNDGTVGSGEGAVQGTIVATYLHGPVLARNPAFADWLLERAVGERLEPLPEGPCVALHDERVRQSG